MRAYKFLTTDNRSGLGDLPAWVVGEKRVHQGPCVLCESGFHHSPTWLDALTYTRGPVAAVVEVSEPVATDGRPGERKSVSAEMTVVALADVSRELRLFAADCAERALMREREAGREPDPRSWAAVEAARQYTAGSVTAEQLAAARVTARAAARDAAGDAAWAAAEAAASAAAGDAAGDAAWAAARVTARAAADAAEREWQATRLAEMIDGAFAREASRD